MKRGFRKFVSVALSIVLLATSTAASFAETAPSSSDVKVEVISKEKGGTISKVVNANGSTVYVATKAEKVKNNYDTTSESQMIATLSEDMKSKIKESNTNSDKQAGTRTNFGFASSLSEAESILSDMNFQLSKKTESQTSEVSPMSRGYFWHGSFVEDYWGYAGHGYHVYLAPVDVSWITNMGWIAGDSVVAALVATSVVTAGTGVILGGIVTAAVVTWSWYEQNNDGSLDIWSPDAFRSSTRGNSYVQVGRHWYWL